jgi:hypothetical protein
MEQKINIEEVAIGDIVDFIIPTNKATSPVKEVNLLTRGVKINYFEGPDAIDRVDKWVAFDNLYIVKKAKG